MAQRCKRVLIANLLHLFLVGCETSSENSSSTFLTTSSLCFRSDRRSTMLNLDSPTPNLTQLLQYSPVELSSGVLIANWIQSKTDPGRLEFDLSQIEPEPKDSVTKYLNWVCLNAKVFNNFGILLNSAQINHFIEGKSTEIYIILKQLHDKVKSVYSHFISSYSLCDLSLNINGSDSRESSSATVHQLGTISANIELIQCTMSSLCA